MMAAAASDNGTTWACLFLVRSPGSTINSSVSSVLDRSPISVSRCAVRASKSNDIAILIVGERVPDQPQFGRRQHALARLSPFFSVPMTGFAGARSR